MKYMGKKIKLINNYNKHDIQFRMKTRNSKINLIKPKKTKKTAQISDIPNGTKIKKNTFLK